MLIPPNLDWFDWCSAHWSVGTASCQGFKATRTQPVWWPQEKLWSCVLYSLLWRKHYEGILYMVYLHIVVEKINDLFVSPINKWRKACFCWYCVPLATTECPSSCQQTLLIHLLPGWRHTSSLLLQAPASAAGHADPYPQHGQHDDADSGSEWQQPISRCACSTHLTAWGRD